MSNKDKRIQDIEKDLGFVIRNVRELAGYTQTQTAECLGTTQQQIERYENGKIKIPATRIVTGKLPYITYDKA